MELYEDSLGQDSEGEISPTIIREISGSLGWMRFISILCMVLTGLGILGLLALFVTNLSYGRGSEAGIFMMLGLVYLGLLGFLIYLYIILLQCANEYGKFVQSKNMGNFENALALDKKFWKFFGIFIIAAFVLSIIASMLFFIVMASAMGGMRF